MTDNDPRLDLSDPAVRAMAERNHEPAEMWRMSGELYKVCCRECGNTWPCETVQALRSEPAEETRPA